MTCFMYRMSSNFPRFSCCRRCRSDQLHNFGSFWPCGLKMACYSCEKCPRRRRWRRSHLGMSSLRNEPRSTVCLRDFRKTYLQDCFWTNSVEYMCVQLHFGVDVHAKQFKIEVALQKLNLEKDCETLVNYLAVHLTFAWVCQVRAKNEASFRCPDQEVGSLSSIDYGD